MPEGNNTFTEESMFIKADQLTPLRRQQILQEAEKSICGQREQDYGSPEDNFALIAKLWSDYLAAEVTALDVAMMMVLLKVARIKNGGGSGDSFVDICGYGACGGEIHERNA